MHSVARPTKQGYTAKESKEELKWKLVFEMYQEDFSLSDTQVQMNTLLDVGTGDGAFVHYAQMILKNQNAYGIDFNQHLVPHTCSYLSIGNLTAIPYTDNLFETVLSRNVLHGLFLSGDVAAIQKALSELIRITKHSGVLMYAIKNSEHMQQAIHRDIQDTETKKYLLKKLSENITAEAEYLVYLQSLGHKVSVVFRGPRRVVKIEKRKVQ